MCHGKTVHHATHFILAVSPAPATQPPQTCAPGRVVGQAGGLAASTFCLGSQLCQEDARAPRWRCWPRPQPAQGVRRTHLAQQCSETLAASPTEPQHMSDVTDAMPRLCQCSEPAGGWRPASALLRSGGRRYWRCSCWSSRWMLHTTASPLGPSRCWPCCPSPDVWVPPKTGIAP